MAKIDMQEVWDIVSNYHLLLDKWLESHALLTSWNRDAAKEMKRCEDICQQIEDAT